MWILKKIELTETECNGGCHSRVGGRGIRRIWQKGTNLVIIRVRSEDLMYNMVI